MPAWNGAWPGGEPVGGVASVASFYVSRVDSAVDPLPPEGSPLWGVVAVANAKQAYQRHLWASTGTKNPAYSDVLYVEALVGPDTVNTMLEATLDAFRDHGQVCPPGRRREDRGGRDHPGFPPEHGVDLGQVAARLVEDGLAAFDADFATILSVIEAKLGEARAGRPRRIDTMRVNRARQAAPERPRRSAPRSPRPDLGHRRPPRRTGGAAAQPHLPGARPGSARARTRLRHEPVDGQGLLAGLGAGDLQVRLDPGARLRHPGLRFSGWRRRARRRGLRRRGGRRD